MVQEARYSQPLARAGGCHTGQGTHQGEVKGRGESPGDRPCMVRLEPAQVCKEAPLKTIRDPRKRVRNVNTKWTSSMMAMEASV